MYMYMNIIFKHIPPIIAKFHVELPWDVGTKIYKNDPGHMTKMPAMNIYGKYLKIFFSRTRIPMIMKLDEQHQGLEVYTVCINDGPWLTGTYLMARSKLTAYVFEWEKLLHSH